MGNAGKHRTGAWWHVKPNNSVLYCYFCRSHCLKSGSVWTEKRVTKAEQCRRYVWLGLSPRGAPQSAGIGEEKGSRVQNGQRTGDFYWNFVNVANACRYLPWCLNAHFGLKVNNSLQWQFWESWKSSKHFSESVLGGSPKMTHSHLKEYLKNAAQSIQTNIQVKSINYNVQIEDMLTRKEMIRLI